MTNPETAQRIADTTQLLEDFKIKEDSESFISPEARLTFLESLTAAEFYDIAQHVNARIRGYEPRERLTTHEQGGYLPMMVTPHSSEKKEAFHAGFDSIRSYIQESSDPKEQQVRSVGMAVEALIIWVHPFADGNGRTSRFLSKFIEEGATNTDELVMETVDKNNRMYWYGEKFRVDQGNITKGLDLLLDDDEIEALKKTEMRAATGITLSIKNLLENKQVQQEIEEQAKHYKRRLESAKGRRAA